MFLRLTSTALLVAFVACADEVVDTTATAAEPAATTNETPAPETSAPAAPVADDAGGVRGVVTFDGEVPAPTEPDLSADPFCEKHDEAPREIQTVVVGEGDGLKDVFVYVTEDSVPDGRYRAPKEAVLLDQIGCSYTPHVFGVMKRQDILIRNSDDTLHNIHAMPDENKEFNVGMPILGQEIKKDFKRPEMAIKIKCDVHPWMLAWCFSMEHPFFGVTDESGKFSIDGLPDGEYELTAWHETLGETSGTVTVSDGVGSVEFEFTAN